MTEFTRAVCLLNEIQQEAPEVAEQVKKLRSLMISMPLTPDAPHFNSRFSLNINLRRLLLEVVSVSCWIGIIGLSWLAVFGFEVTQSQWGASLVLSGIGCFLLLIPQVLKDI